MRALYTIYGIDRGACKSPTPPPPTCRSRHGLPNLARRHDVHASTAPDEMRCTGAAVLVVNSAGCYRARSDTGPGHEARCMSTQFAYGVAAGPAAETASVRSGRVAGRLRAASASLEKSIKHRMCRLDCRSSASLRASSGPSGPLAMSYRLLSSLTPSKKKKKKRLRPSPSRCAVWPVAGLAWPPAFHRRFLVLSLSPVGGASRLVSYKHMLMLGCAKPSSRRCCCRPGQHGELRCFFRPLFPDVLDRLPGFVSASPIWDLDRRRVWPLSASAGADSVPCWSCLPSPAWLDWQRLPLPFRPSFFSPGRLECC